MFKPGLDENKNDCLSETELKNLKNYFQVKLLEHGIHKPFTDRSTFKILKTGPLLLFYILLITEMYRKMTFQFHNFQLNI